MIGDKPEWSIFDGLQQDMCPDCGGFIFRPGPRGGLSQNIECIGCGSGFNVTRYQGNVIWAERILYCGASWPEDLFPKVLQ